MKNSIKSTIAFFVSAMVLVSCSTEDESITIEQEQSEVSNPLEENENKALSSESSYTIAQAYSPIIYQDLDRTDGLCRNQSRSGSADWIAAVNYDGDWVGNNNWENLTRERSQGDIKGKVYYTVNETQTHVYILYSIFHPRDWTDIPFVCGLDSHENDMEGILVCARKTNDDQLSNVEYVSSIFHSDRKNYRRNELLFNGEKVRMFIEAKGHGIQRYTGSGDLDGSYIKYVFGNNVTQPVDQYPNTSKYSLTSLYDVWQQRNNSDLFAGTSFRGDNGRDNAANAPWAWGAIATDPAQYINSTFNINLSTSYVRTRPLQ